MLKPVLNSVCLLMLAGANLFAADPILRAGSTWKYWDKGSEPPAEGSISWKQAGYSEAGWLTGAAQLGYGDGDESTLISFGPNASAKYITAYFRKTFTVGDLSSYSNISLNITRDDGAVIYLNGTEIGRFNMSGGQSTYSTYAVTAIEETVDRITLPPSVLNSGENLLAVEIHQANATSSDLSFDLELVGEGLVTRGPYLQMGTSTSIVVRWRTAFPTNSLVRFGTSPDPFTWSQISSANATTEHEVMLNSLQPNSAYYYSINNPAPIVDANYDYIFYTAPALGADAPVRIWALGDSGTADANAAAVRNAYFNFAPNDYTDLVLMLGDNAYNNGYDHEYQVAVFEMYSEILRQTVLWPTIGNHDTAGSTSHNPDYPYFQMFTLPTSGEAGGLPSGVENYYSFDYANVHFVCLDSMTSSRQPGSAMLRWLDQDLAANTLPWVIAFWHHPPYSKGSHDSDNNAEVQMIEMRRNVLPILDSYNVDLVLAGHSHSYERSYLLSGHYGSSSTLTSAMVRDDGSGRTDDSGAYNKPSGSKTASEGAVYVVAGSSGKKSGGSLNHPAMFLSLNELGSLVIDVSGKQLDVKFLRENGQVVDYFTVLKNNQAPSVTIDSPASGASFTEPNVLIAATATDVDGSITEVSFFANGTMIGSDAQEPFSFPWSNMPYGTHTLVAEARDDRGATALSPAVTITITEIAPAAPSDLTASAISSTEVQLNWVDASSNEAGFTIERSTDGSLFALIESVGINALSYTDSALSPSTTYYYRLSAFNSGGSSLPSNVAFASTPAAPPASPANLFATAASSSEITLNWSDLSANESGFRVEWSTDGINFFERTGLPASTTQYADTSLSPATKYYYRVVAYNHIGNSLPSNIAFATTFNLPPTAPEELTATTVSSSQIGLSWIDSANETGYRIERSLDGLSFTLVNTIAAGVTTFTDSGLNASTLYYYRVTAFNNGGSSAAVVNAATADSLPAAPTGLTGKATSRNTIELAWMDWSSNEAGFVVQRKSGKNWVDLSDANVSGDAENSQQENFTLTSLNPNTSYSLRIRAHNGVGSSYSGTVTVKTPR